MQDISAQTRSPADENVVNRKAISILDRQYILAFDIKSMVRLALGTGILVSTVLLIPDTIAIVPSTHEPLALLIRVTGLWLTAFIQWVLAFLGIISFAGIVNRGIIVDENGISLSRFSKKIPWTSVVGMAGESRPLISRLMFLKKPAVRLQLYVQNNKDTKVRTIDSLFFSEQKFESLLNVISISSFGFSPDAPQVVIAELQTQEPIKKAYKRSANKGRLLTAYIAIMLMAFIGRGAARNYFYNQAGQYVNVADYKNGKHFCELSLMIDGTYPPALDRLARCEYRSGDNVNAELHWHKALNMKPDMVSAKVGLSNILMNRKDYGGARTLLTNAIRLEPRDIPVHLNLGHLNIETGRFRDGIKNFETAITLAPTNATVKLLASRAYLTAGNVERAKVLFNEIKPSEVEKHNQSTYDKLQQDLIVDGVNR
ncbi:MAG: tetratricopeptide repeat protein [Candidatus Melainabacteria bacterium]|nr:tetratricopeptide repeat protein [Candidatus Melainabacteria bacterium]